MKKDHLPIGTIVGVRMECVAESVPEGGTSPNGIRAIRRSEPYQQSGQIVGGTYVKEGGIRFDQHYGHYFIPKNTRFVYLVRPAFLSRPMRVLPEDIEVMATPQDPSHIIPYSPSCFEWTQQARQDMREEMSTAPRDKKGRWQ